MYKILNQFPSLILKLEYLDELSALSDIPERIAILRSILEVVPRDLDGHFWGVMQLELANSLTQHVGSDHVADFDQAIELFRLAQLELTKDQYPDDWSTAELGLGVAYMETPSGDKEANMEVAIHHLTQALTVRTRETHGPRWASIVQLLGQAYGSRIKGDRFANMKLGLKYLSLAGPFTHNSRMSDEPHIQANWLEGAAMSAAELGDMHEAVRLFTEVIHLDPTRVDSYHNRGMAFKKLEDYTPAIIDFTTAIELEPHASSYEQRAILHMLVGDHMSAKRDLLEALQMDPSRSLALACLGRLMAEEEHYEEAIAYFSRAINIDPRAAGFYAERAHAHMKLGNRAMALRDADIVNHLVDSGQDTTHTDRTD